MSTTADPQRHQALDRANQIRLARVELKRRIASGEVTVADVLAARPEEAATWAISDLLISQRHWGVARARKVLSRERIPELKPVERLTDRQCRVLSDAIGRPS